MNIEKTATEVEFATRSSSNDEASSPEQRKTREDLQRRQREEAERLALKWKEDGNAHYGRKDFAKAAEAYQSGLHCLLHQPSDSAKRSDLAVALKSNLAQVLLKLEKYKLAHIECCQILEVDPNNAKVLYRRALAREGTVIYEEQSMSLAEQQARLSEAIEDLNLCFSILEEKSDGSSEQERQRMKVASKSAFDRLKQTYAELAENTNNHNDIPASNTKLHRLPQQETIPNHREHSGEQQQGDDMDDDEQKQQPPRLTKAQQKEDVIRLLLSRQMTAKNNKEDHPPTGEAFFLLDWNWWCRWCRYVDFFYDKQIGINSKDPATLERVKLVLRLMPPGAVLPTSANRNRGKSPSDDSDSEDEPEEDAPPGVIDNSRLIFGPVPHVLFRHWYDTSSLVPNLVRGYHYELLPREVYCALRSWYGEVTPSLCRRTTEKGVVVLYPSKSSPLREQQPPLNTQKCSACRAPRATARCKRCLSVHYCDRSCQEGHWPYHRTVCKANNRSGLDVQTSQIDNHVGWIGLNNVGNTCFMNSALQCLSHVTPLTRHFLSNKFKADVNITNPLGTGGKLASAYDMVMKDLWMKDTTGRSSFSPTALKRAISLFAPRFAGCLQHDAQEFLAYLLDGLHEDLNRVRKAPYVEMPDVTDGQDMAIAGAEAWDAHRRRNNSLVMDTVYGQFKSTCVCPKCDRVSVSFDAFNHVSLEIPQIHNQTVAIPVLLFRAVRETGSKKPVRYGVSVARQSNVAELRRELSDLTKIPPDHLILCDLYESSIYELLHDTKHVSTFRATDVLAAYEVEPYASSSIHAVVTHYLLESTNGESNGDGQLKPFGFPFMTSFSADATCREVWDHLWNLIDYMVVDDEARDGFIDREEQYRREDVLEVRVVDSDGKPLLVFDGNDSSEEKLNDNVSADSLFSSDVKIRVYLDNDCTENYLFLSLIWRNPRETIDSQNEGNITRKVFPVNPERFVEYLDHPSIGEALRRQGTRNGQRGVTLDQCFETFTKPERLDENNMWYCSKCKEHVRALKTMELWRLPNVLVIHLKRFEFKHALRRDKLDTFVDFPVDGLDMDAHSSDWIAADGNNRPFVDTYVPAIYDLFAVVNHYGRMGFGHYTAFARKWDESGAASEWALFDDSSVRGIGEGTGSETVVTPAAYVLFYRRRIFN